MADTNDLIAFAQGANGDRADCGIDPAWRTVRPPLVELTPDEAKILAADLKAISFTMPLETKK